MTPSSFRLLVKNFTALTPAEYATLQSLVATYPYCQVIHVLSARASKDLNAPDQQERLHRAAVYATDRSVVKWAIGAPTAERALIEMTPVEIAPTPQDRPIKKSDHPGPTTVINIAGMPSTNPLEGDALRSDLSKELNRLQQLKHDFETTYVALQHELHPEVSEGTVSTGEKEAPLIEEIKSTRKKLKIPSPKVAEQGEIIDHFIKVAPTLPKVRPAEPTEDLAKDSASYSDNIVSETLVTILVKQGKKVKAIEMLKKLIWKFPQKKAYFAAQIEALKN